MRLYNWRCEFTCCSYKMNDRKIDLWHCFALTDWWCIQKKSGKKSENMDVGCSKYRQKCYGVGRAGMHVELCTEDSLNFIVCMCRNVCRMSFKKMISRVSDQNGVSLAWYIIERRHSGREPSICLCGYVCRILFVFRIVKYVWLCL